MSVRNIRWPGEQEAVLTHIREIYGQSDYDTWSITYGHAPTFDPADCFVLDGERPGEIAGHGMIIPRQIQIGESVLPTAEISLLGMLDSYQGLGGEQLLLEAIHQRMTERGDVFGLSFGSPLVFEPWQYEYAAGLYLTSYESDIATDLALKAGSWDPAHSYERRTADQLGARGREVAVRRFYLPDLPTVKMLYAAESARGHYLMARDDEAWNWQIENQERLDQPDDFIVAEEDDRLVAYARLVTQRQINTFRDTQAARFSVIEAAGDHPDGIESLLGEIARMADALTVDRIGLFVHPQSAFMRHALVRGANQRHFTGAGFLRLHNLPAALQRLAPTLEARHSVSECDSRAYHLIIRTENQQAEVTLGTGGSPEIVELEAPATVVVRLLTGWFGIDRVVEGYQERHALLLRSLFPQRDPKIGLADLV
ncbi:MAG: GNAT family N-acetyltransferase [Chloroflexi bacterium]|nr:GNAT family N-acetyltransferase [Chloroflexota bacterium]